MKRIFLDTCILMAAAKGKDALSEKIISMIDDSDHIFVSSDFVKLECLPKATYNKMEDEKQFYNTFFEQAIIAQLSSSDVKEALSIACNAGLGGMDALHIKAAMLEKTDEFVTAEKSTKPFSRISFMKISFING